MSWRIRLLSKDTSLAMEEIEQCIELQKDVRWNTEIVPSHVFRADSIHRIDESFNLGYVLIATIIENNREKVIGFARVTFTNDLTKQWLHEIVTASQFQSSGVGVSMMQAIKTKNLELGGKEVYFTYDPFEGQNGRLYLTKCGARAIKIYEDLYGRLQSVAHVNRKTHRFLVQWDLQHTHIIRDDKQFNTIPVITNVSLLDKELHIRVEIPYKVQLLTEMQALDWQEKVTPILVEAINIRGYQATHLQTIPDEQRNFLVLENSRRTRRL